MLFLNEGRKKQQEKCAAVNVLLKWVWMFGQVFGVVEILFAGCCKQAIEFLKFARTFHNFPISCNVLFPIGRILILRPTTTGPIYQKRKFCSVHYHSLVCLNRYHDTECQNFIVCYCKFIYFINNAEHV